MSLANDLLNLLVVTAVATNTINEQNRRAKEAAMRSSQPLNFGPLRMEGIRVIPANNLGGIVQDDLRGLAKIARTLANTHFAYATDYAVGWVVERKAREIYWNLKYSRTPVDEQIINFMAKSITTGFDTETRENVVVVKDPSGNAYIVNKRK